MYPFFAPAARGLEALLKEEIERLGGREVKETVAGVAWRSSWEEALRILLWSRLASRLLMPIAEFPAPDGDALYRGVSAISWQDHLDPLMAFVVDATLRQSSWDHSHFASLRTKDAIVDQFRKATGQRPDVDRDEPDLRLNLLIKRDIATLSLDVGGMALHRRGYRQGGGEAPLKESLAAAVLLRAGWPEIAAQGGSLLDPMCGSGTLLFEAALIALDIAPGLLRPPPAILRWKGAPDTPEGSLLDLWHTLTEEAEGRRKATEGRKLWMLGADSLPRSIAASKRAAQTLGLSDRIQFHVREISRWGELWDVIRAWPPGLVIANPPYGERLGELPELVALYTAFGQWLRDHLGGWRASLLTGNPELCKQLRMRPHKRYKLFNGALPCELFNFQILSDAERAALHDEARSEKSHDAATNKGTATDKDTPADAKKDNLDANAADAVETDDTSDGESDGEAGIDTNSSDTEDAPSPRQFAELSETSSDSTSDDAERPPSRREEMILSVGGRVELSEGAIMFKNRLQKMKRHFAKWLKREEISCYRVYDADMPEYNVAIDMYGNYALIQEYEAPLTVDPERARRRLFDILLVAPEILEIPRDHVILKVRRRQRGDAQYGKFAQQKDWLEVEEGGCRFLVNLTDYLDTGLFLDHRLTRRMIQEKAKDRHFLNLFAYTGTATVYAAAGGATTTLTVDMSHTYLSWARENMEINGFSGPQHRYLQADCLAWLEEAEGSYDLIFLDPPTFSNSKRMQSHLDVQRDHVDLIREASRLLDDDGLLIFSTNHRSFKLEGPPLEDFGLVWEDISRKTLPKDFERDPKIHRCFAIRPR